MNTMIKRILPVAAYDYLWHKYFDMWSLLFSILPIEKKKVIVFSYYGADYGDNGKSIVNELLQSDPSLDIVWVLKSSLMNTNHLPEGVRPISYYSLKSFFELETAAIWIDNARKTYGRKRSKQLYIQTWHGGPGMKRVEQDVEEELGERYVTLAKKDSKMCDLILSNSTFMTNLYRRAFWYDGEILECGSPRNDSLVNGAPEIARKIREFWNLPMNVKLVLYAPTFRKDKSLEAYNLDALRTVHAMSQRFGGTYVFLLRLHPNISDKADLVPVDGKSVINATDFPDMQELLAASDCLITDYSSSNFDFSLTGKPCFLYASDIEQYRNNRGYYFNFEDMPFPIAVNNDEMEKIILNFDLSAYHKKVKEFHEILGVKESGKASQQAVDRILAHIHEIS